MPRIEIVPPNPDWAVRFHVLGRGIRERLGETALAIHHIGSTAVPGLAAKDVIDIQVTVADLDVPLLEPLAALGYRGRDEIFSDHMPPGKTLSPEDLSKRMCGLDGPRVHLHIRVKGKFNTRYPLLCRDYLRGHPLAADAYAEIKRALAARFPEDTDSYYAVKDPVFDLSMVGAEAWADATGWTLPPTDA